MSALVSAQWRRLDIRMLAVHPLNEAAQFAPVLLASFFVGRSAGHHYWSLAVVAAFVVIGALRWFTTTYRITDAHIELRRGIINKKLLVLPRNRIRSIEVNARLLHRLLGLAIVVVGTGHKGTEREPSEKFTLNAIKASRVDELREVLLDRQHDCDTTVEAAPASSAAREIARWQPSWLRYPPFSTSGFVMILAIALFAERIGVGDVLVRTSAWDDARDAAGHAKIALVTVVGVLVVLAVASLLAVGRSVVDYGNLRITRDPEVLHVRRGLLTARQTTFDNDRLRGAILGQPLGLRLVRGATLSAIMTGVSTKKSALLPPCPAPIARRVLAEVVGDASIGELPLTEHGPVALRRRFTRLAVFAIPAEAIVAWYFGVRHATFAGFVTAGVVMAFVAALAGVLAWDRYRGLGHALAPGWIVMSSGSLLRSRRHLATEGVVAWVVRQSFWQRRSGVATLVAATAAGAKKYEIRDVPLDWAWDIAGQCSPWVRDSEWSTHA